MHDKIRLAEGHGLREKTLAENAHKRSLLAHSSSQNMVNNIVADLLNDNIVKDTEKISFTLNNNQFEVNGERQPAAVHEKFRERYLKGKKDHINYSRDKNSRNTNISINEENKEDPS
jgi:hypothetical protein